MQPRLVFGYLNEYQYDRYTLVLLLLASATIALELSIATHLNKGMSFTFVINASIIAGGIFGTIVLYLLAAIASWVGNWFGSMATGGSLARVIAHGLFPVVIASLFTALKISEFDKHLFRETFDISNYSAQLSAFYIISSFLQLGLAFVSLVFIVIGTSQVQRLPIGQAILNVIIPALILAAVGAIIAMPFL